MPDQPTPAEIMRRLDEAIRQITDLAAQMREDRQAAAATYVRQDVYTSDRRLVDATIADVRHDVGAHDTDIETNRKAWENLNTKINDRFRQTVVMVVASLLMPIAAGLVLYVLTVRGGL